MSRDRDRKPSATEAAASLRQLNDTRVNASKFCVLHRATGCRLLLEGNEQGEWVLPRHHATGFDTAGEADDWCWFLGAGYEVEKPAR